MLRFINPDLNSDDIRASLTRMTVVHEIGGIKTSVLEGSLVIENFLTPEARQHIEGQVYSSGTDLAKVYRTSRAGFGKNEISIAEADRQVPVLGELRTELDTFLSSILPGRLTAHVLQLRELMPKESGHPRHVDYDKAADVIESKGTRHALTSISLSLPISWNEGRAPVFIMESKGDEVLQAAPGSLAIFGPRIYHAHPPTDDFDKPYLWLVTQAFFAFDADSDSDLDNIPAIRQAHLAGNAEEFPRSVASWASLFISDPGALQVLQDSESRIRRAYSEMLSGYDYDPATILNEVERVHEYKGVVVVKGIDFTSMCGHHFLPFFGTINIAYEPSQIITGLGKIPRLVQVFARRLQLQEDLVRDIATQISISLQARGVAVVADANHLCMHSRGPLAPNSRTRCVYALGTLEHVYSASSLLDLGM